MNFPGTKESLLTPESVT